MRSLLHFVSWPSAAILALSLPGSPSVAPQKDGYRFQYAAKIVCAARESSVRLGLVPQAYSTTINVHNPSDSMAAIAKKVALTIPPGMEGPGKIVQITKQPELLQPDQAMATDCVDIMKRTGLPNQFEGFVVIYSTMPLDVVGVYAVLGGVDVVPVAERPRHLF